MKYWLDVLLKLPIDQSFAYSSSVALKIGSRILVSFGSRELIGLVISVYTEPPCVDYIVKPIIRIIDKEPLFNVVYLDFAKHVARYSFAFLGETLFSMLPSGKKEVSFSLDALLPVQSCFIHQLNKNQKEAYDTICKEPSWYYLFGHTGSGKTAVFLELIDYQVRMGRVAIYLLPEIALLSAVQGQLEYRFGKNKLAILHSGLTPSRRLYQWRRILHKEVFIILGVRSAIFAPVSNLGIIILDEEHDASYKSQATPRYHARQVAMHLAKPGSGITLVLGSATPSLEAYHFMQRGIIKRVNLEGFAGGGQRAHFEIIDMKKEPFGAIFSHKLIKEIWKTKELGKQSALFMNRRGFGRYYLCSSCRFEAFCPNCAVSLTYHLHKEFMMCHYCGYSQPKIESCPQCGSLQGEFTSFGAELVEKEAKRIFVGMKILRLDSDIAHKKNEASNILKAFWSGEADILIGTQMLAKGFNFPYLRVVALISADIGLNLPDFRATERLFAFVQQVAGRVGRYDENGLVLAQSYKPKQTALQYSAHNDTEGFLKAELDIRKKTNFPPFSRLLRLVVRGKKEEVVILLINKIYRYWHESFINYDDCVEMLGPSEAVISKIASKFRWQIIFKITDYVLFHKIFTYHLRKMPKQTNTYCEIEHDPVTLL